MARALLQTQKNAVHGKHLVSMVVGHAPRTDLTRLDKSMHRADALQQSVLLVRAVEEVFCQGLSVVREAESGAPGRSETERSETEQLHCSIGRMRPVDTVSFRSNLMACLAK